MFISLNSFMTGVTSGIGTANSSGAPRVLVKFVLLNLFFPFCFRHRFMASDYSVNIGIFKLLYR